jgi:hypothetical protein
VRHSIDHFLKQLVLGVSVWNEVRWKHSAQVCLGNRTGSGARYTATIVTHAERRDIKSALLVDIDGLDVDAR